MSIYSLLIYHDTILTKLIIRWFSWYMIARALKSDSYREAKLAVIGSITDCRHENVSSWLLLVFSGRTFAWTHYLNQIYLGAEFHGMQLRSVESYYRWLNVWLQKLQCVSNVVTAILHLRQQYIHFETMLCICELWQVAIFSRYCAYSMIHLHATWNIWM